MNIDSIKTSLSEMPRDGALKLILDIRLSRRTRKKEVPNKPSVQKVSNSMGLDKMLANMSQTDIQNLIKMMGGSKV